MAQQAPSKVHLITESSPSDDNKHRRYRVPRINLKQWRMLDAVVSCGSFANAAEHLHVSQPAISYTIAKLEELLGVPLLRIEGRKAQITDAGRALLERSRRLLHNATELEEFAESLRAGHSPQVKIAVGTDFPTHVLLPALRLFSTHVRSTNVGLIEMSLAEIDNVLRENTADLAIHRNVPAGLHGHFFSDVEYVAVAHPEHPLFRLNREVTSADLARETQIISTSDWLPHISESRKSSNRHQQWRVSSFDSAKSVLLENFGYGWLPKYRIEDCLKQGLLKVLPLDAGSSYKTRFFLVHPNAAHLSVAANHLIEILLNTKPSIAEMIN